VIAPIEYTALAWSINFDRVGSRHMLPDAMTWLGAAVIVSSGIYLVRPRAQRAERGRRASPAVDAMKKLPRAFYDRDPVIVAHELLGKHLVHVTGGIAADRPHRRSRGLSRSARSRGAFGARTHAAHARDIRTARTRLRLSDLRHASLHERGDAT